MEKIREYKFDRLSGGMWGLNKGRKHFSLNNRSYSMIDKLSIAGRESSSRSIVSRPVVDNLINNVVLAARGRRSAALYCWSS
jgi:hypothetical protein